MRRQQAPHISLNAPAPQPQKVAPSLEEWEAKAPLDEIQFRSIADLKKVCEARRLPAKFSDEADSVSRPATPVGPGSRMAVSPSPRQGTPAGLKHQHPLHPTHPITTPQEFHDWFALIDKSISHSQEAHFRDHLDTVSGYLGTCDALIEQVHSVDEDVAEMLQAWIGVEEGGQSLQGACERMLEEKDRLIQLTEAMEERLEYFQELEYATRMLNTPGDGLVLQDDFLFMVERVDLCIEYLEAHREYKESQLYLMRYQHCLTRAMTLIKMHFVNSLRSTTFEVQKRVADKDVSSAAQTLLLYPKFASSASTLRPVLAELETRAAKRPEDLSALLAECHAAYFAARKQLITTRLMEEIQRVIKGAEAPGAGRGAGPSVDLVELTRTGCSYVKQLCTEEFNLYKKFFDSGEDKLYRFLEGLCDYLYDDLRPRILHEPKLAVLCQVCTVIQALMVLDLSADYEDVEDDYSDEELPKGQYALQTPISPSLRELKSASFDPELRQTLLQQIQHRQKQQQLRHLHIGNLLEMVLQDAQTRLVFKAQAVLQSEIRYYVAKDADLDYPQKLSMVSEPKAVDVSSTPTDTPLSRLPSLSKQATWYPTLRKTHWVLSQLYDYVKPAIFEDIAYEAISLCRESLTSASESLVSRPKSSATDGQLFLIRHLLVLKEIATALGLDSQKERGVDFRSVTDTLGSLIFNPNAVFGQGLSGLRFPKVVESIADARMELDGALKAACESAISQCVATATSPLQATLSSPAELSVDEVSKIHAEFLSNADGHVHEWAQRLRLYLDEDEVTVGILLSPMQAKIIDVYEAFRAKAMSKKGQEAYSSIAALMMSPGDLRSFLERISS